MNPTTNRPSGWPSGRGVSWQEENGKRFLSIQSTGEGRMDGIHMSVPVPDGVRALELSYEGRVTGLVRGEKPWYDARVILNLKDAFGSAMGNAPPAYHRGNTDGWVSRSVRFIVPEGVSSIDFMPSLFRVKSGRFDLADIALTPVDHEALEAQLSRKRRPTEAPVEEADKTKWPAELFVVGNRLEDKDGNEVWLQGVNIASLDWGVRGDSVLRSTVVAIDDWNANVIRLPVKEEYWFGRSHEQSDGGKAYRELIDAQITIAANRGAYVVLDLHRYRAPRPEHIEFWRDAATRYRNHPAVLFDLINEPHGISWEVWRNGGFVPEGKRNADENAFLTVEDRAANIQGFESPGMQKLVETVRSTGAHNVIVAGGLDYAYDLSGILEGYALEEQEGGNGIMYASHIYPWKSDWQGKMLDVAALYPVLIGEVGADERKMPWETDANFVPPEEWVPDMIGLIQKYRLNWTAWCFHPTAGPRMLNDWTYEPTPFWGAPVKRALSGEVFKLERKR